MSLDEQLARTWAGVTRPSVPVEVLRARIKAQRRRWILHRGGEVLLTLAVLVVFGLALRDDGMTPRHWLLLPFYAVFLPVAWTLILRTPRSPAADSNENVHTYARLRLAQLRASLRELEIARRAALALLLYAVLAASAAWWLGSADWRQDAGWMLACAATWLLASELVIRRRRRRRLREYRAMRRLLQ